MKIPSNSATKCSDHLKTLILLLYLLCCGLVWFGFVLVSFFVNEPKFSKSPDFSEGAQIQGDIVKCG